jgi:hypothetical protein
VTCLGREFDLNGASQISKYFDTPIAGSLTGSMVGKMNSTPSACSKYSSGMRSPRGRTTLCIECDPATRKSRERAFLLARLDPPPGVAPDEAVAAGRDVLDTIGDACPECPPEE